MPLRGRIALLPLVCAWQAAAADNSCPAYPPGERAAQEVRLTLERESSKLAKPRGERPRAAAVNVNFIDDILFGKMAADGIDPAPPATDAELLRRVMLDLTGRIPSPEQVTAWLQDENAAKYPRLIDSLIGSEAFVDNWTLFYARMFEVTSDYYYFIGIPGRNQFYRYLRDFVEKDRPYREVAAELISAAGDSHASGPPNFLMRGIQFSEPVQDTWDELTNNVTGSFLGVQSQCISCHDGRRHLEKINLYLSTRRRQEFWQQSAFFSRMSVLEQPVDAFNQQRKGIVGDRTSGGYNGVLSDPNNPGPRPTRTGGPYEPAYLFSGERPKTGQWRKELARIVTADRQFARAAVNYLWAHFFRVGIVDPPNAWDLARIDPAKPPGGTWTLQPSNPELIETLATVFMDGGYRLRPLMRLMVESRAYQLSSRYPGTFRPEYARYFAKQTPRRLSAEEIYDAMTAATQTATPMYVEGFAQPLLYASQLPDPTEPRADGAIQQFLQNFGRGDWWRQPRETRSSVVQVLYLMNDVGVNFRTFGNKYWAGASRVARLAAAEASDREAVTQLTLATLGRLPTAEEIATAVKYKHTPREEWLSDVQWVLLNELEFLFNH
jgi:hypothetical protein